MKETRTMEFKETVTNITRIVYTDKTGEHQVATMDDGMLYGGDSGTVIKKKIGRAHV